MPTGNILRLVPYGRHDRDLTSNPEITQFRKVFRKHTPFARETLEFPFSGDLRLGQSLRVRLPVQGDFIGRIRLRARVPPLLNDTGAALVDAGYTPSSAADTPYFSNGYGFNLIKSVDFLADGQKLASQSGKCLQVLWRERMTPECIEGLGRALVGYVDPDTQNSSPSTLGNPLSETKTVFIDIAPFISGPGCVPFPIAATTSKTVEIVLHLRDAAGMQTNTTGNWGCNHPTTRETLTLEKSGEDDETVVLRPPSIELSAEMDVYQCGNEERRALIEGHHRILWETIEERHVNITRLETAVVSAESVAGQFPLDFNGLLTTIEWQFQSSAAVTENGEHTNLSRQRLPSTPVREADIIEARTWLSVNGGVFGETIEWPTFQAIEHPQVMLGRRSFIPWLQQRVFKYRNEFTGESNGALDSSRFDSLRLHFVIPEPPRNDEITLRVYARSLNWVEFKGGLVNRLWAS